MPTLAGRDKAEFGTHRCTLLRIEQITGKALLCSMGNCINAL